MVVLGLRGFEREESGEGEWARRAAREWSVDSMACLEWELYEVV